MGDKKDAKKIMKDMPLFIRALNIVMMIVSLLFDIAKFIVTLPLLVLLVIATTWYVKKMITKKINVDIENVLNNPKYKPVGRWGR